MRGLKMNTRIIGWSGLVLAVSTLGWVIMLGVSESGAPQIHSIEDKIRFIESQPILQTAVYLNAGLLTILTVAFMSALYVACREQHPFWATVAFAFVPIYGLGNIVSYLSQVFLVPTLIDSFHNAETHEMAKYLLSLTIHTWPRSAVESINALSYAVLGIPSLIFPHFMMKRPRVLLVGGILLALSGIMSIAAFTGTVLSIGYLTGLSVAGGVVFLFSLIPITWHFLRMGEPGFLE